MKDKLTGEDVVAILRRTAQTMESNKDYLCELDGAMGDGDQGITMTIGFRAIVEALPTFAGMDVGTMVARAGMTFNGKAASTIGALLATGAMRAGREAKGKTEIDLSDLTSMLGAATEGIMERGKAKVGDKTVLDMLAPTVAALKSALDEGASLSDALKRSLVAADEGVKATIPLKSNVGRGAWLADRSIGHQDPGATSFYLMWKSLVDYVSEE